MKSNSKLNSAMLVAAQLTATGSLTAATAAIQRALAGEPPAAPPPAAAGGEARAGQAAGWDTIDVQGRWLDDRAAGQLPSETAMPRFFSGQLWGPAAFAATAANEAGVARPSETEVRQGQRAPRRMLAGSHAAPAGRRDYLLHVPPETASETRLSLVVMLHGCTQTPADFAAGTAMNALADRHGFMVLYPAQTKTANQSACWNWFSPRDQRADSGEPSIIAGMVREVLSKHPVDPARVYVAGLSAGGAMAAILADAYPELFAAVAVHSGLPSRAAHDLPSALNAMKRGAAPAGPGPLSAGTAPQAAGGAGHRRKPVRTIVFHGRQDRTVHPVNGRQVVEAALSAWPKESLGVTQENSRSPGGRSYLRTVHADAVGRPMVEQWEVQGAGHAWSGGSPEGSYTDPLGPDASAAMVTFFQSR